MKNNHGVIIFGIITLIAISAIIFKKNFIPKTQNKITVAIIQTAFHPALDAAREAFITTLQKKLGNDITFVIANGQGSISTLHTIAQQFHARDDLNAIYAIASPAAQAITSIETHKPIIIAAVTVAPELVTHFNQSNICGVSDMINVKAEINAMHALIPTIKNVGIIFNTAESNSVTVSKIMEKELQKKEINTFLTGIISESDIEPAILSILRKVDALIAPTDNVIASSIALITELAHKAKKPLIVSDNMLVKYGPLMARGVDYYENGIQAAQMAMQIIINHKKPYELGIVKGENKSIFINAQTLTALNLVIPESLASDVIILNN